MDAFLAGKRAAHGIDESARLLPHGVAIGPMGMFARLDEQHRSVPPERY